MYCVHEYVIQDVLVYRKCLDFWKKYALLASKHLAVLPILLLFLFQTSPCINWSNASLDIPDILITTFTATKGKGIRASQPNLYSTDNYTTSRLWNKYFQSSNHRYEKKTTMHYLYTDWLIMIKASPAAPRTRYGPSVHPPQPAQTSRPIATSATQRKLEHNKGEQSPKKSGLGGIWQFGEIGGDEKTLGCTIHHEQQIEWEFNHHCPLETPNMGWSSLSKLNSIYLNQATGCQECSLPWQLQFSKTFSNWKTIWLNLDRAQPTSECFLTWITVTLRLRPTEWFPLE